MTLKARTFEVYLWRGIHAIQRKVQRWLKKHPDIEVVSTNCGVFNDRIGYILIYRDPTDSVPDSDHDDPLDDDEEEPEQPIEASPTSQPGSEPEPPHSVEKPASSGGITTGALFGQYDPFKQK